MSVPDHVDVAYSAIRQHLHDRPYHTDPARLYRDLGSVTGLLSALDEMTVRMGGVAERATSADDGQLTERQEWISVRLEDLSAALHEALVRAEAVHAHVSHLIFDAT